MRVIILTLALLSGFIAFSKGYNILVLMPYDGKSHFDAFGPLFETLSEKDHHITLITFSRTLYGRENIQTIWLGGEEKTHVMAIRQHDSIFPRISLASFKETSDKLCRCGLQNEDFQNFLRESENTTFDIILAELFVTDCFLGLVNKFKAPMIGLSSCANMPWHYDWFGVSANPAYVQNVFGGFKAPLPFLSRVENTLLNLYTKIWYRFTMENVGNEWSKKYTGYEAADPYNTSLILVNSHYTLTGVHPLTPSIVEVGGLHVSNRQPKKLPQDLENWINNSDPGVIYFSLGSMIKGDTFPEEQQRAFAKAFAKLPQRILWKWEIDTMSDKPDNVMIGKWMPQFDILCHPNVKLFISHGGMLGTVEAVHCGVPIIVMPQFGDQSYNAHAIENKGVGVMLHIQSATEEKVTEALKKALDPQVIQKAKALSELFRDRPMSAIDTAVYWVEHVARYKGAPHMRSPAIDMPLYQSLLLDVIAFLILVAALILYILYQTVRLILAAVVSPLKRGKQKIS